MSELVNLQRVVLAGDAATTTHWPVRVLAVELYDVGLIVRYVAMGSLHEPGGEWFSNDIVIRDDVGTPYEVGGLLGGGHGLIFAGPAVPAEAGWLDLEWGGEVVRVNL